jgi:hypothetical protein
MALAKYNLDITKINPPRMNYATYTDKQIYRLCQEYGAAALAARRKFAGLLPEVDKRRLYERRGYGSIYHFAAQLAGMSHEQVDVVLRLERRLGDKPILHRALTEGQISVNKLACVVSIATVENHGQLAEKIATLSQAAVEVFVRDYKNENGLRQPTDGSKSLRAQTGLGGGGGGQALKLDADVEGQLLELQAKGIDINVFLRGALERREREIAEEKDKLAMEQVSCERATRQRRAVRKVAKCAQEQIDHGGQVARKTAAGQIAAAGKPVTRYVPVKIRRVLRQQYGTRCSMPDCHRQAANLHHEKGFAATRSHDPRHLKPLCAGHHLLAHAGDRLVQRYRSGG